MSSPVIVRAAAGAAEERGSLDSMQLQRSVTQLEAARGRGALWSRMLRAQEDQRGRAAEAAEGYSRSLCDRPKEVGNTTQEKASEGDVKSS
jgi:hypothetical protein